MTKEELAKLLDGREYRNEISESEEKEAKESGLVIVHGASDDLLELRGAIYDEFGCYDGGEALIDDEGLLPDRENIDDDDELEEYFKRKKTARKITAVWCGKNLPAWTYKTSIPHSTFNIMEDGDIYCRGMVFELKSLSKENSPSKTKPKRNRDRSLRSSPAVSATEYPENFEMIGNDGHMYKIIVAKNGIHRWAKKNNNNQTEN